MLKTVQKHIILSIVLAAFAAAFPIQTQAQARKSESPESGSVSAAETRRTQFPFHGRIHSVDKEAMTLALEGKQRKRIVHVTARTRITKDGKPAKFSDALPGEEVGGLLTRTEDGKEEAVSLRLGPKPGTQPAGDEPRLVDEPSEREGSNDAGDPK